MAPTSVNMCPASDSRTREPDVMAAMTSVTMKATSRNRAMTR
jgi:hypothetical protein